MQRSTSTVWKTKLMWCVCEKEREKLPSTNTLWLFVMLRIGQSMISPTVKADFIPSKVDIMIREPRCNLSKKGSQELVVCIIGRVNRAKGSIRDTIPEDELKM